MYTKLLNLTQDNNYNVTISMLSCHVNTLVINVMIVGIDFYNFIKLLRLFFFYYSQSCSYVLDSCSFGSTGFYVDCGYKDTIVTILGSIFITARKMIKIRKQGPSSNDKCFVQNRVCSISDSWAKIMDKTIVSRVQTK